MIGQSLVNFLNLAPAPAAQDIPLDYEAELSKIKRQQTLADALRSQASEAIPIQSYKGIQAPIPWTEALSKAMKAYSANAEDRRATSMQDKLTESDAALAAAMTQRMNQTHAEVGTDAIAPIDTKLDATAPQLPGQAPPAAGPQVPMQAPGQMGTGPTQAAMSPEDQLAILAGTQGGGPRTREAKELYGPLIAAQLGAQRQAELARKQRLWEDTLPMGRSAKETAELGGQIARTNAGYANQLPPTQNELLTHQAAMAAANKPQIAGYGSTGTVRSDGTYTPFPGGAGVPAPGADGVIGNPNGKSPQEVLGISGAGYKALIGDYTGLAPRAKDAAQKEADGAIIRMGLDPSIVGPRIAGYKDTVKMATMKDTQIDAETENLIGSAQNLQGVADKIAPNDVRWANDGYQYVGTALNNKDAQKYMMYLTQMRSELAGLNAVLGGKIGVHGQIEVNESHIKEAERVIQDGLSRGGAQGIIDALRESKAKSRRIAQMQGEHAQRGIWNALGLGPQFDKLHPQMSVDPEAPAKPPHWKYNSDGSRELVK